MREDEHGVCSDTRSPLPVQTIKARKRNEMTPNGKVRLGDDTPLS